MSGFFVSQKVWGAAALAAVLGAGAVTATPAAAHGAHHPYGYYDVREDVRDHREDRRDAREDIRDRREDYWDAREDIYDARHFTGPGDIIEDYYDRREDIADRREDYWDAREDVRDAREDRWDRHH